MTTNDDYYIPLNHYPESITSNQPTTENKKKFEAFVAPDYELIPQSRFKYYIFGIGACLVTYTVYRFFSKSNN